MLRRVPRDFPVLVIRGAAAAIFLVVASGKFLHHARETADFKRYGIPLPSEAVLLSGTVEVIGALTLITGIAVVWGAAALAANLIGAVATAGRVEGGAFNLGLAPALLVTMLFLIWWYRRRPRGGRALV